MNKFSFRSLVDNVVTNKDPFDLYIDAITNIPDSASIIKVSKTTFSNFLPVPSLEKEEGIANGLCYRIVSLNWN